MLETWCIGIDCLHPGRGRPRRDFEHANGWVVVLVWSEEFDMHLDFSCFATILPELFGQTWSLDL